MFPFCDKITMMLIGILIISSIFLAIVWLAWKGLDLAGFFADFFSGLWHMILSFFIKAFRIKRG